MSSILKALKKIDSRKAETQLPVWPYRIDNRESMNRHSNRALRHHKVLGILIVVCAAALAGKLYFGGRDAPESTASRTAPSVKTAPPAAPDKSSKKARVPAGMTVTAEKKPAPSSPTFYRPSPTRGAPVKSPVETGLKTAVEVQQAGPENNANLMLQALVWSEQPEERFVVVNGSILREGGMIENCVIYRIEPEYVTIRSGATTWRLTYGH